VELCFVAWQRLLQLNKAARAAAAAAALAAKMTPDAILRQQRTLGPQTTRAGAQEAGAGPGAGAGASEQLLYVSLADGAMLQPWRPLLSHAELLTARGVQAPSYAALAKQVSCSGPLILCALHDQPMPAHGYESSNGTRELAPSRGPAESGRAGRSSSDRFGALSQTMRPAPPPCRSETCGSWRAPSMQAMPPTAARPPLPLQQRAATAARAAVAGQPCGWGCQQLRVWRWGAATGGGS
jgi:hypothetical protein